MCWEIEWPQERLLLGKPSQDAKISCIRIYSVDAGRLLKVFKIGILHGRI